MPISMNKQYSGLNQGGCKTNTCLLTTAVATITASDWQARAKKLFDDGAHTKVLCFLKSSKINKCKPKQKKHKGNSP